jgi:signal transduction histidine kinase
MNMPIAGILASMSSLRDKHEPGDLVQMFREVTTGIQALSDLQKNISEYANGTPGALKIDVIETAEWIKSVVSLYRPVAAGKRIKLHEIVTELVPETIRSDRGRLTRIISNLIFNAIRFTGPDKRIVVRAYMFKGMLNIDVTDQGPGIPKDMQFDIFQAHVKLDKMSPGCGLGLSIVKANLNDIGGEIVIRSEVGKGSTFTFTVPNILY